MAIAESVIRIRSIYGTIRKTVFDCFGGYAESALAMRKGTETVLRALRVKLRMTPHVSV